MIRGGTESFVAVAQKLDKYAGVPCSDTWADVCSFPLPPGDLAQRIWGPVPDQCQYDGTAARVWTFGCNVGVDMGASIDNNDWGFRTYGGQPYVMADDASTQASAAARRPQTIALGRRRVGRRAGARAFADVRARTSIPRRVRLARASVRVERLLFERVGDGELARPHRRSAWRPRRLAFNRSKGGGVVARGSRPNVRVHLRRIGRRNAVAVVLQVDAATLGVPRTCHALPAAVARPLPVVELDTSLRIRDQGVDRLVRLVHRWRCARDARGNITRLVSVREGGDRQRGGLAARLTGPRTVRPGSVVAFRAVVRNRRTSRVRAHSSLFGVAVAEGQGRVQQITELRRGRTRSFTFTRRVPQRARGRFCSQVGVTAVGARGVRLRTCARVASPCPARDATSAACARLTTVSRPESGP